MIHKTHYLYILKQTKLNISSSQKNIQLECCYSLDSTGKETDCETGFSYFGARYYDPTLLTSWTAVDPMSDKYPNITPYAYCNWNPVKLIDPNGMEAGDYYSYSGKYLGSDGKNDNKIYVATGTDNVVNNDGTTSTVFINAVDLGVTHDEFCTISNIVMQESSHAKDEDLWIAHTANNAAKRSGKYLYNKLKSGYSSVKDKSPLATSNGSQYANSARAAVINVLTGGNDPTGGASLWDGTDFLAWGTSQNKFKEYRSITISKKIYETYLNNNLAKYKSGRIKYSGQYYSLPAEVFTNQNNWNGNQFNYNTTATRTNSSIEATGAVGMSIFWKIIKK